MDVVHLAYFNQRFDELEKKLMSLVSDKIAEVTESFDELEGVVVDQGVELAGLKASAVTPEDMDALETLRDRMDVVIDTITARPEVPAPDGDVPPDVTPADTDVPPGPPTDAVPGPLPLDPDQTAPAV